MKNNVRYDLLSNKIEKTAILFELYKGLKEYFNLNPDNIVDIVFSFDKNSPKSNKYINFKSSTDEGQSVVFSNIFHFLKKCVVMFEPMKSPFGLLSYCLINEPQEIKFSFSKENFLDIFDYADSFNEKSKWLELLDVDYIICDHNNCFGKYPTMVFNEGSYNLWQEVKLKESFIKNTHGYKIFQKNINIIKECYEKLKADQNIIIQKSYLTIFEEGKIIDSVELDDFKHINGTLDKKDDKKNIENLLKNNMLMIELNYSVTEEMLNNV